MKHGTLFFSNGRTLVHKLGCFEIVDYVDLGDDLVQRPKVPPRDGYLRAMEGNSSNRCDDWSFILEFGGTRGLEAVANNLHIVELRQVICVCTRSKRGSRHCALKLCVGLGRFG